MFLFKIYVEAIVTQQGKSDIAYCKVIHQAITRTFVFSTPLEISLFTFICTVTTVSLFMTAFLIFRSLKDKHVTESVEKGITENDSDLTSPKLLKTSLSSNEKVVQQFRPFTFGSSPPDNDFSRICSAVRKRFERFGAN